jgi:hypothetical protein
MRIKSLLSRKNSVLLKGFLYDTHQAHTSFFHDNHKLNILTSTIPKIISI